MSYEKVYKESLILTAQRSIFNKSNFKEKLNKLNKQNKKRNPLEIFFENPKEQKTS